MMLRSLRSLSYGAFVPRWPPLRSSHLVALRATTAGPAARAGQRAYGPSIYRGSCGSERLSADHLLRPVTGHHGGPADPRDG